MNKTRIKNTFLEASGVAAGYVGGKYVGKGLDKIAEKAMPSLTAKKSYSAVKGAVVAAVGVVVAMNSAKLGKKSEGFVKNVGVGLVAKGVTDAVGGFLPGGSPMSGLGYMPRLLAPPVKTYYLEQDNSAPVPLLPPKILDRQSIVI